MRSHCKLYDHTHARLVSYSRILYTLHAASSLGIDACALRRPARWLHGVDGISEPLHGPLLLHGLSWCEKRAILDLQCRAQAASLHASKHATPAQKSEMARGIDAGVDGADASASNSHASGGRAFAGSCAFEIEGVAPGRAARSTTSCPMEVTSAIRFCEGGAEASGGQTRGDATPPAAALRSSWSVMAVLVATY